MLWVALIIAISVGAYCQGWHSLRLARQGDLQGAHRALFQASLLAAACGIGLTTLTLGWPFKEVSVSVPEEVSRTVVETVLVPVQFTYWIFFKATRTETREVSKEVREIFFRRQTAFEFSPWLLIPMALVGLLCFYLEKGVVHLLWRWFG